MAPPQTEVLARDDTLVFATAPLSTPLRVSGPARLHLAVSTTARTRTSPYGSPTWTQTGTLSSSARGSSG